MSRQSIFPCDDVTVSAAKFAPSLETPGKIMAPTNELTTIVLFSYVSDILSTFIKLEGIRVGGDGYFYIYMCNSEVITFSVFVCVCVSWQMFVLEMTATCVDMILPIDLNYLSILPACLTCSFIMIKSNVF